MVAELKGQVVAIVETKTKKDSKPYRVVTLLQVTDRGADTVRVNLWNGQKVEKGKDVSLVARIRVFDSGRGAALSADAY